MKRSFRHIAASILILGIIFSCSKNEDRLNKNTFVKVYESDVDLVSRNALQSQDGTLLQLSVAHELLVNSATFGTQRSRLLAYSLAGDWLWDRILPQEVHRAIDMLELPNGDLFVVGYDSIWQSSNVGLALLNDSGKVKSTNTFFNSINVNIVSNNDFNYVSSVLLSNGEIALALTTRSTAPLFQSLSGYATRIVIVDQELNVLRSMIYDGTAGNHYLQMAASDNRIIETPEGDLAILGTIDSLPRVGARDALLRIDPNTLELSAPIDTLHEYRINKNLLTQIGNRLLYTSLDSIASTLGGSYSIRNGESIWFAEETDINVIKGQTEDSYSVKGFPSKAGIVGLTATSDGGVIVLGTCNLIADQSRVSEAIPYLIKYNNQFQEEWRRTYRLGNPTYPTSVQELGDGYLISGTSFSIENRYRPILIKTDFSGNLN